MTPSLLIPASSVWLCLPTATEHLCHLEPGFPILLSALHFQHRTGGKPHLTSCSFSNSSTKKNSCAFNCIVLVAELMQCAHQKGDVFHKTSQLCRTVFYFKKLKGNYMNTLLILSSTDLISGGVFFTLRQDA